MGWTVVLNGVEVFTCDTLVASIIASEMVVSIDHNARTITIM
jgi:hypothetical protein